jgi:predicted peptidase
LLKLSISLIFALLILLLCAVPVHARKRQTGLLDRQVTIRGVTYRYQVFVPLDWTPARKWPVILFLHGAGERGDDGIIQTEVGIGTAIRRYRARFPAVVVFPQCLKEMSWSGLLGPVNDMEELALKSLEQAQKEFHGDPQRVYLTGISMGGYGTFALAAKYPRKFAALVPICGGILSAEDSRAQPESDNAPYARTAQKIGPIPVWIFHGTDDNAVPVAESRRMSEAMKAIGGEVRYTEYPGVKHDSWVKAYAEPDLLPWLLSKYLASPGKQ